MDILMQKTKTEFSSLIKCSANSTEFSAKILQDFYSCYEIWFELLAKVSITGASHNNTCACAHFDFFKNTSVEVSIH